MVLAPICWEVRLLTLVYPVVCGEGAHTTSSGIAGGVQHREGIIPLLKEKVLGQPQDEDESSLHDAVPRNNAMHHGAAYERAIVDALPGERRRMLMEEVGRSICLSCGEENLSC